MYGYIRVSYHLAMVEEFFLLLSAVVVGDITEIRRTEAVKLSVKLLSGLSLIALVAVAVVTLSQSANAAVDGKVYVTNKASGLTTEPSTALSATTVYGTYADTGRDIVTYSDFMTVTVIDEDVNVTDTITTAAYDLSGALTSPGLSTVITLSATNASPIVGALGDIKLLNGVTNAVVTNVSVKTINYAGNGTSGTPAIITVGLDYGDVLVTSVGYKIQYPTSITNELNVNVKSVVNSAGITLTLLETGRDTGRFVADVQVIKSTGSTHVGASNRTSPGVFLSASGTEQPANIPVTSGPVTVTYVDAASASSVSVTRTAKYSIDVTVPTVAILTPTHLSESQNRFPSFTGNAIDAQSGLDVSAFALWIDVNEDVDEGTNNATKVIGTNFDGTAVLNNTVGTASTQASIDPSTFGADGISSFNWAWTQDTPLPVMSPSTEVPNNLVDFQALVSDLAGNVGYSDSDTSATAGISTKTGRWGNQAHVIKIDQKIPSIVSASAGTGLDPDQSDGSDKANVRDTIKVTFDGKVKESSISVSDFKVTLSGVGGTFVPASIAIYDEDVYLDIDSTIPSDNTPTVTIQGTIQDLAGNSTDAGSQVAADDLSPILTVTRSAGTGTGTGLEAADSLTKKNITFTITSDEDLNSPPVVTLTPLATIHPATSAVINPAAGINKTPTSLGGNVWSLSFDTLTEVTNAGDIAVQVTATDVATNEGTIGSLTTKAFTFDKFLRDATSTPAGTTTQSNPFLTSDFGSKVGTAPGEAASVSIVSATLDGVDVTSSLIASADSKTFFFQPATALTNGSHKYIVNAIDAAGNTSETTTTFTKADRTDFVVELFAGWNSVSFPSNPLDTDVNSVLSNSGIKQVVAYDATTPSQPWRIASKVGSAAYTSQTTPGLTSIAAGPGYWVETSNFEDQKVALEGPTGPGDARPGLATIPTGNGWNLVGVVDQSRSQTQSGNKNGTLTRPNAGGTGVNVTSATYFNTVNSGRAYTFDTVTSKFRALVSTDTVTIGSGIWVYISPQTNGQLPNIVP